MKIDGKKLPTRLQKQPIVDAVAELRFATSVDASLVLPGSILKQFPGAQVSRLPAAEIPDSIRQKDENLKHQPLIRIEHEKFFFLIGSSSIAVGCNLPYQGWTEFLDVIRCAVSIAMESQMMNAVTRYSLKYSDVIECEDPLSALAFLDININVAGQVVGENGVNVQFSTPGDGVVHLTQIALIANLELVDGTRRRGALISIDSISVVAPIEMSEFSRRSDDLYSKMHQENKEKFFSCLHEKTLEHLGAEYV